MSFTPKKVVIRHGIFWYFAREKQVIPNQQKGGQLTEQEVLVQRIANQNEEVELTVESDYQRGVEHHAFWTDEELSAMRGPEAIAVVGAPAVVPEGAPGTVEAPAPSPDGGGGGGSDDDEVEDPMDQDVAGFDDEQLRDWLTGTGEFDGQRKPNQNEVAGLMEGELAERLYRAESQTREKPRQQVQAKYESLSEGSAA